MTDDTPDAGTSAGSDQPAADAHDPLTHLLRVLDLAALAPVSAPDAGALAGDDLFRGDSVLHPNGRVYGGQVLAQALVAAGRTLDADRPPHSLHGYFLRPGDLTVPIDFAVERLRDGRSFSARRTHAVQHGRPILSMIASFQEEQGGVEYAGKAPVAPDPEDVPSAIDVLGGIDHPFARHWSDGSAFELRHVDGALYVRPAEPADRQLVWVRARGVVPDDPFLHRALLLYACDQVMLEPIMRAKGVAWPTPGLSVASLDHAMWWHRDVRVDEWLLFEQTAVSAQGGRGLGAARVWSRDGRLVASMGQEGMIRVPVAD